ncbi:hypothetical protein D9M71_209140 [compost metagenome]
MLGEAVAAVDRQLVLGGEGHLVAGELAGALLGFQVGVAGVQVEQRQGFGRPEHLGLDALVAGAAEVLEAGRSRVVFDLILEIDAIQAGFQAQVVARAEAHAGLVVPGQLGGHVAVEDDRGDLRHAQRALGVGVEEPLIVQLVADAEARQPFLGGLFLRLLRYAVDLAFVLHAGVLVAHPRGDGQAAVEQADGVADVGGLALVVEGPVAEHGMCAGAQVVAVDLEVDVFLDQAGAEHPGLADRVAVDGQAQARFAAPDAEVARRILQGGGGGVGSERQADDEVAVAVVGEVGPAELHAVEGAEAAEVLVPGGPDAVGVALEAVEVAGRLARIVPVVGHAERAGQIHVGDVALHAEAQAACVVDVPLAAQAVVLYRGLGVLAAVLAVEGVEIELQGETVGDPAAGADVAVEQLATAGGEGDALLQGGFPLLGNRRADEVDHPADVVRAVLYGGAAAHHVDALDGGQGLRE